jgi:hypothetical protein
MNGSRPSIECYCLAVSGCGWLDLAWLFEGDYYYSAAGQQRNRADFARRDQRHTSPQNYVRSTGRRFPGHRTLLNQPKSSERGMGRNELIGELEKR